MIVAAIIETLREEADELQAENKRLRATNAELVAALETARAGLSGIRLNRIQIAQIDAAIAKAEKP